MLAKFLFALAVLGCYAGVQAQNYCARDLCPRGRRHVACGNNGRFAASCRNPRMIDTRPHTGLILQLHNERRNRVAGGGLRGFPSAVQMGTMSWDPELARLAALNVLQCRMAHDQCRNTNAFRFAGQNLSVLFTRNVGTEAFLRQRIESWFNEWRSATRSDVERYRPRSGPQIGHFTAMVNEKNDRVGCAVSQYDGGTLLACNYAVTNMIDNPIYRFGAAGSQCRSGRNPRFRNLCSVNERYSHNQWAG